MPVRSSTPEARWSGNIALRIQRQTEWDDPSGFPFHSAVLSVLANFNHQISDHNDVDQQYGDSRGAHSFGELIDFQRNERRRGDNRKVFSPALAQPQTNALGEQERRVKENARAEFFQLLSVKGRKFLQQPVNVAIVGI